MRRAIFMAGVFCLALLVLSVASVTAQEPKVTWGGLFYIYDFFHSNTDFNKDTDDGNTFTYIHGDIQYTVDFGKGVSLYTMIGAWAQHGANPYWGCDLDGRADPEVRLLQAYITVKELFDTPLSLQIGKQRLLYGDGAVMFDGGEDGATGTKLTFSKEPVDVDLFYYRLAQAKGINYVGAPTYGVYDYTASDQYPGNVNMMGLYGTLHLMEGKLNLSGYGVLRPQNVLKDTTDKPLWLGARAEGSLIENLSLVAEFTMMSGEDETEVKYKGKHFRGGLDYSLGTSPLTFGGAYVSFSGDDHDTKDNELYESAVNGPYTFGFYKDWPGFGPAHLMTTSWGFAGVDPGNITMTNLSVINGHLKYTSGPLALRLDFFNYGRNWVSSSGNKAMGNEIAVLASYNYKDTLTLGFTGGMWMPGDHIKKDWGLNDKADNAIGGYFYLAKSF